MNCKNKSFMTKRKAFTLIELLIVIAIIGILFIVLVSKVDFATDKAKATGVQTDFRSFQMAFDTVAKENAGFNTFGWDTGDANQDGIRNSYDEGDNGAGGGIAQNGIQDGAEVFTGHKVYAETFTKVYSLKKNGAGDYDRDALNRLETAINANLDPKLHITIKDDGEIVMANGAKDPWNKEYHGWYITNAETDKQDRGAIVMYSDGANNEFGSEHKIANGIVSISIPGSNKNGKDDYAVVSCYTYLNGYGEVKNMTSGFSNNQGFVTNGTNNNTNIGNGNNLGNNEPSTPDPIELEEGLFDADGNKLATLEELRTNYGWDETKGNSYQGNEVWTLSYIVSTYFPEAHTFRMNNFNSTANGVFRQTKLNTIILHNVTAMGIEMFWQSEVEHIEMTGTITELPQQALSGCANLRTVKLPETIVKIGTQAIWVLPKLESINISPNLISSKNGLQDVPFECMPTVFMEMEEIPGYLFAYNFDGTITFGPKCKKVGSHIAYGWDSDTSVTFVFLGTTPPVADSYAFRRETDFEIRVPAEALEAYKAAPGFSNFADHIFAIED